MRVCGVCARTIEWDIIDELIMDVYVCVHDGTGRYGTFPDVCTARILKTMIRRANHASVIIHN